MKVTQEQVSLFAEIGTTLKRRVRNDLRSKYAELPKRNFVVYLRKTYSELFEDLYSKSICGKSTLNIEEVHALLYPDSIYCEECGTILTSLKKGKRRFCSLSCTSLNEEIQAKKRKTNLEKFGTEWASQSATIKNKIAENNQRKYGCHHTQTKQAKRRKRKTCLKKYGVDNALKSPEVQNKCRATLIEKYGADNPQRVLEIRQKTEQTNLEKYGHTNFGASPCRRKKAQETSKKKFGVANASSCEQVKAKRRETNLRNSGYEHNFSNPEVRERAKDTCEEKYGYREAGAIHSLTSRYDRKEWVDKNGTVHYVQGFEPYVLDYLNQREDVVKIVTDPRKVPHIKYKYRGKTRTYIPDIVFKLASGNWHVIEVKSTYTLADQLRRNLQKFKAAIKFVLRNNKTQTFWLAVYDRVSKEIDFIKSPNSKEILTGVLE